VTVVVPGCELVGGAVENYKRDSTHLIKAEYTGLEGKTFAVVIAADRAIQADHPGLLEFMTKMMTDRLSEHGNVPQPSGYVPADDVLRYLYDNPSWPSKPMTEVAQGLGGVDRIVYVELHEYQLHDPGNLYEWAGVAAGNVSIVEVESPTPDTFAFERTIGVKFPDKKGFGPNEMASNLVTSALASRFVDRTTWLCYDHQEPYYPDY